MPDTRSTTSNGNSDKHPKLPLNSIMHKFERERSDITLFLNLFERQARSNLLADELVTHLLALLLVEITELILREPKEKIDDFPSCKNYIIRTL